MVYITTQHSPTPPTATQFLCTIYCTITLGRGKGGGEGEVREKVEGSKIATCLTVSPVYKLY
jgi:hypothetical protein